LDLKHNAYYWHNEVTGHSVWNEDDCFTTDTEASVYPLNRDHRKQQQLQQQQPQQLQQQEEQQQQQQQQQPSTNYLPFSEDLGFDNARLGRTQNSNNIKKEEVEDRFIRNKHFQAIDKSPTGEIKGGNSVDSDDVSSSLLDKDVKKESCSYVTHSQISIVHSSTSRDIWIYSVCIFINALLIEGPLAAAEGIIRCIIFLTLGFIMLLMAALFHQRSFLPLSFKLFRESLLCVVTTLTLCIPGASCLVYRRYSKDDDWELAPIPTLLGMVDARRFISFSFGNGSFANNVHYSLNNDNSLDMHHNDGKEKRRQHQWPCQDSWPGSILLEPRRIQTDMILIVRGEDPFGILS
jgi:hypothetical protein